jgi:hypothetical protein
MASSVSTSFASLQRLHRASFNELLEMDRVASGSVFAILVGVSCPLLVSIHLFRVIFDLDEDISLGFFGLSVLDFKE